MEGLVPFSWADFIPETRYFFFIFFFVIVEARGGLREGFRGVRGCIYLSSAHNLAIGIILHASIDFKKKKKKKKKLLASTSQNCFASLHIYNLLLTGEAFL